MGLRGLRGEPGGERNGGRQIAENITTTTNIILAVCGVAPRKNVVGKVYRY